MGFMAGVATGFFKQQNQDTADQQSQTDKLTQLSLANILKNTDSYNASKADYQSRLTEAQALASQTGLQVGDVMNMKNMGLPNQQIILQGLHKPAPTSPAGNVNQQTNAAIPGSAPTAAAPATDPSMGGGNSPNAPATTTPAPVANAPQGQAIPGVKMTLADHLFGTDPSANIGSAATSQASTVTGLSSDELQQARTGHYTPTALPTSGFKIDPSSLIDYSKIKASDYSAKNLPIAIQAAKQGDWASVASLADTADDKTRRQLQLVSAEHDLSSKDEFAKENHDIALMATLPGTDGKPIGLQAANQAYLASKYKALTGTSDIGADMNPQNLDPQSLYQSLPPAKQAYFDGYTSGRVPWIPGSGKQGQETSQAILKQIQQVDPTFSPAVSKARTAAYQDLTSTKGNTTGGKLVSAATVINHITDFADNINKVGNTSSLTPVNDASNAWQALHGNVNLQNAKAAQGLTSEEMSKFLAEKGAGATDADKERTLSYMPLNLGGNDPASGLPRNQVVIDNLLHLMVGKLGPMADKINDNFGTQINAFDLLPQESLQKLRNLGYKVPEGTGQTATPNGIKVPLPGHSIGTSNWSTPQGQQPSSGVQELPVVNGRVDVQSIQPDATYRTKNGPMTGSQLLQSQQPQGSQ